MSKSAVQYDTLRDLCQAQGQVVLFQGTQNWKHDDTASDLGWSLSRTAVNAKATVTSVKPILRHARHVRSGRRWAMPVLQTNLVMPVYMPSVRRSGTGRVPGGAQGDQQGGQ